MGTVNITLSRALELKNILAGRIKRLEVDISRGNSVIEGGEAFDVDGMMKMRQALVEALIQLRVNTWRATQPILDKLYRVAESKGTITFLRGITTTHGANVIGYSDQVVNYKATMRHEDIEDLASQLEVDIDRLQQDINRFNGQTSIEVDERINDLTALAPLKSSKRNKR